MVSGQIDNSTDCRYVVWVAFCGLGNRILSITSAFLYALITNRVLLINQEHDMGGLFCEPFPDTSWILPEDFLFKSEINSFEQNYNYSYGYMLKSNIINYSTELLPSYMFLCLSHDYDHHDKLFFCDQDQALLSKVPWLIMKSNVYFLPSLFLISSFEQELSKLFPDKETVFHHLGRYLFQPSNLVWRLITQYYQDYLAKAEKRIEVDTEKTIAAQSENQTSKAVLITSLFPGYFKKLKNMYGEHSTKTGETVAVYQPSLGGMRPWILYKINQTKQDPFCGRGMSMEPCYHAPPIYDCKAKTPVYATLVPHGIKMFNSSS
ncbi:hypothetical protein ACOSQ2_032417 [Xanthoceras sorbifolium]